MSHKTVDVCVACGPESDAVILVVLMHTLNYPAGNTLDQ